MKAANLKEPELMLENEYQKKKKKKKKMNTDYQKEMSFDGVLQKRTEDIMG